MTDRLFPEQLLNSSKRESLSYFNNEVRIQHRIIKMVLDKVMEKINCPGDKNMIFIIGPTGVGKTMLCKKIVHEVNLLYEDLLETNFNVIPVICLAASAASKGNFSFKQLYKSILEAAQEPLIDYKIAPNGKMGSEEALLEAAKSCIKNREIKVVIIDEAQHIAKVTSSRKVRDQLETLKSFIDNTEAVFVLSGTYNLNSCFTPSGQINRRSAICHFSRYRKGQKVDVDKEEGKKETIDEYDEFVNIVKNFELRIPITKKPNFDKSYEYIYARSVGCIGLLKDWLYDALKKALSAGSDTITTEHLEQTALEIKRCLTIAREAIEGEQYLENLMQDDDELYNMLQINTNTNKEINANTNINSQNGKPGNRSPKRDSVGADVG
ncbi:MAG: ATPase [Firmicutes bacterium]|nr:ATPase [Bacillota bacterium]